MQYLTENKCIQKITYPQIVVALSSESIALANPKSINLMCFL